MRAMEGPSASPNPSPICQKNGMGKKGRVDSCSYHTARSTDASCSCTCSFRSINSTSVCGLGLLISINVRIMVNIEIECCGICM